MLKYYQTKNFHLYLIIKQEIEKATAAAITNNSVVFQNEKYFLYIIFYWTSSSKG